MKLAIAGLRDRLAYQGVSLGVIALVASAALAFAVSGTRERIAAAEARDLQASLSQVLPERFADNDLLADTLEIGNGDGSSKRVYLARRQGEVAAAIFQTSARGYAGEVLVLVGICTHLGCSPTFRPDVAPADLGPAWKGGFFCPCHGSRFDLAGRVYKGVPAPSNLEVPSYRYLSDTRVLIGVDPETA